MDYVVSDDGGCTWSEPKIAHFRKRIRNGQMASLNGYHFMHGRGVHYGKQEEKGNLVLYSSRDGLAWDDGVYLKVCVAGAGEYSNSIVVNSPKLDDRRRLLIQGSHTYEQSTTNVFHWSLDVTKHAQ